MKRISFPSVAGLLLCLFGLSELTTWYLYAAAIVNIMPTRMPVGPNSSLCFSIVGFAILLMDLYPSHSKSISVGLAIPIILIAGSTLLEYISQVSLGIDHLLLTVRIFDSNPHPGRMSINIAFGFLTIGFTLILFSFATRRSLALLTQVFILCTLFIGVIALLGYFLHLEFLYSWYRYTRMTVPAASGMLLASSALWFVWLRSENYTRLYEEKEEQKIIQLSIIILAGLACVSAFAGFSVVSIAGQNSHAAIIAVSMILASILIGITLLYALIMPMLREITESRRIALGNNERLTSIFENAAEGIIVINAKGIIESCNSMAGKIFEYHTHELVGNKLEILMPERLRKEHKMGIQRYLKTRSSHIIGGHTIEVLGLRRSGEEFPLQLAVTENVTVGGIKFIGMMQDITHRKLVENELSQQAFYDALTGLANRGHLLQNMSALIVSAQQGFAVFYLDLDHFKQINDSLGHDAGDQLLCEIASRLKESIRAIDIAARIGGDEFVLVLQGINNSDTAAIFAEKIQNAMLKPCHIGNDEFIISTSMGISFFPHDGADCDALLKSADLALYHAKEKGRANYQFCTPEMNLAVKEKNVFRDAVRSAIDKKEFELVFLPRLDVVTQKINSFDALLRWHSEEYGNIPPARIIPLAEEMGLIVSLGDWILKCACEQLLTWDRAGFHYYNVTVNVSPRQFIHPEFAQSIIKIVNELPVVKHRLELEVSESLITHDITHALDVIAKIRQGGVLITVDNFGVGYSSLSCLSELTPDRLKIDRTLVSGLIAGNKNQKRIIDAIVVLARNLGIRVLAEGIENESQYKILVEAGCDELQGYFISHPLELDRVLPFICYVNRETTTV